MRLLPQGLNLLQKKTQKPTLLTAITPRTAGPNRFNQQVTGRLGSYPRFFTAWHQAMEQDPNHPADWRRTTAAKLAEEFNVPLLPPTQVERFVTLANNALPVGDKPAVDFVRAYEAGAIDLSVPPVVHVARKRLFGRW
jgi:hypothetical protein